MFHGQFTNHCFDISFKPLRRFLANQQQMINKKHSQLLSYGKSIYNFNCFIKLKNLGTGAKTNTVNSINKRSKIFTENQPQLVSESKIERFEKVITFSIITHQNN